MNLDAVFDKHEKVVFEFSGGKDSLATAILLLPWRDRVKVVFCDMGDTFPHVLEFVEIFCHAAGFDLTIIKSSISIEEYWKSVGYPVDNIPFWNTLYGNALLGDSSVRFQSPFDCCMQRLFLPMDNFVKSYGATCVIRGAKETDPHKGVEPGVASDGIEYVFPLWEWSAEMVFEFLKLHQVNLPHQYQNGCEHSLDCMRCTGWIATGERTELERLKYTKHFYPAAFQHIQTVLRESKRVIEDNFNFIGV